MAVRLIAGRAGSGKTHWCQSHICEALASSLAEGPRLILLVPEQAALQMERGLLALSAGSTLGRCEVLSFRRLAHRILSEAPGRVPVTLTPTGRHMALRHLLGRHRRQFQELGKVADRGGVIAAIARSVAELLQEAVTTDQLQAAAQQADASGDPSAARLHDTALLYKAYLDYLGSERVDPDGVLDLARARLESARWLSGCHLWIDGFAGLTEQQVRMIVALSRQAAQVDIALLLDPADRRARDTDAPPEDVSLFARTQRTWFVLVRAFHDAGIPLNEPVFLGSSGCPRFKGADALARIERRLFTTPIAKLDMQAEAQARDTPPEDAGPGAPVRWVKAPDRRTEVSAAIRALIDLVQRPAAPLRYRDVAIVVRDLGPYHDLISAGLRARGIPFFIDRRRPTHHHPLVQCVRGALAMHGGGSFDRAISMVLKSGLAGLGDEAADALENYVLAHGLVSAETWEAPWTYPAVPSHEDRPTSSAEEDALEAVNRARADVRQRLGAWWPTPGGKRGRPACRSWVGRLYSVLERLGVSDRLAAWSDEATARGDLDEAEECRQVWADLVKLLDELVEMLGDQRMTGRQFADVLESGLATFTLGLVPATVDQVLVSSIERSRHPPVRAVFVLGFEDGQFPARVPQETILGDDERAGLEACGVKLGRVRSQQLLDERMLAYVAVTRPSEFLWVSFAESNEAGKPVSPSLYWPALRAALPEVPVEITESESPEAVSSIGELAGGIASHMRAWCQARQNDTVDDTWLSLYEWARSHATVSSAVGRALTALAPQPEARLTTASTAALLRAPYRTSVTGLEQFARCPFQHFAGRGLRLVPRSVHEISALDMGSLYHSVLKQFVNELMESGRSLRDLTTREIAGGLSRWCQTAVALWARETRIEEHQRKRAFWRGNQELPRALAGERAAVGKTQLAPVSTERSFGSGEDGALPALELRTPQGRVVRVHGKIDRIDFVQAQDATVAVVFDYKRSLGRRLRLDEAYHGLALQLLAYLLVMRDHGRHLTGVEVVPGGAFYLPLLGPYERVAHPDEADEDTFEAYKHYKPRGVLDFDWIDQLEPRLESGWGLAFSVYRKKDGSLGNLERSDAVAAGALPALLDHVRRKMGELADDWLSGSIAVAPARLGKELPCSHCSYRAVCRFEYSAGQARPLSSMTRGEVLDRLSQPAGGADG